MSTHLDLPCTTCAKPIGDHLVRELHACGPALDLPMEAVPGAGGVSNDALRHRLGFDEGTIVADHVVAKAVGVDLGVAIVPAVVLEFAVGDMAGPPRPVVTVGFLGDPGGDGMLAFGRLMDDAATMAVRSARGRNTEG